MGLFSRFSQSRRTADADAQQQAIAAFWSWWREAGAAEAAAAVESPDDDGRVSDEISRRVRAIHEGLAWELSSGRATPHLLVVSAEGDARLRAVARRWHRAAPEPDSSWEYADTRQPQPDLAGLVLTIDDVEIDAGAVMVSARVTGTSLDVGLYSPAFARLPEDRRRFAALLLLGQAVGEAAVQTWVGSVAALTISPLDPIPLATVSDVVRQLEDLHTDGRGRPVWARLEGRAPDGRPVIASAQVPLRAATAPHLDTHVGIAVEFSDRDEGGLPGPGSAQELRDLEDHLGRRLEGSGQIVAHETHAGTRLLHAYVDSTAPAVDVLRAAVAGWRQGAVRLTARPDPDWDAVAHLRG